MTPIPASSSSVGLGEEKHPVTVKVLPGDLSKDGDIPRIEQRIEALDTLTMLVNNVGFGTQGPFADIDPEKSLAMIQVHVTASTRLAHAALPGMMARRRGTLVNVASPSAFVPLANNTVYSATKSYLISFSECLQLEVADAGIKVQVVEQCSFGSVETDVLHPTPVNYYLLARKRKK